MFKFNIEKQFRIAFLTILALIAFAANSVLCRLALGSGSIDAASFTGIRLISGALTLAVILFILKSRKEIPARGSWISAAMLFLYAIAFSFAYRSLDTGTGALILFGAVQLTMILTGLRSGERPHWLQWTGLMMALGGLIYLVSPGLTAPSPSGSVLMAMAGIAWGIYSLRGRGAVHPVAITADNFLRSTVLILPIGILMISQISVSPQGMLWAALSGSVTSGIGYVIWYGALRGLSATRAAIVQLSVPVLAAFGGVLLLSEVITWRLFISAIATLGGVGLAVMGKEQQLYLKESKATVSE